MILLSFILRQFLTIESGLDFLVHSLTLRTDLYSSFLSGVTLTGGVETILAHPLISNFHFHLFFFSLESPIAKALGSPFPIFALTLPKEFTELGEITYLSLSHCQLTGIPEYLGLALFSLPRHRLSISNLSFYLSTMIDRFPNLTRLDLSNNFIPSDEIVQFLKANKQVKDIE